MMYNNLSIVGCGKVGTALGKILQKNNYNLLSVICKTEKSAKKCAKKTGCRNYSTSIKEISEKTNLIMISVPDSEIKNVVKELVKNKKINFNNLTVFHTSGCLSYRVLDPLRKKKVKTLSIHPFQTFNGNSVNMEGVYYGIEGISSVLKIGKKIVSDLGGNSIVVPSNLKPLYHISAVLVSNYFLFLLNGAFSIFKKIKLKPDEYIKIVQPIISQSMANLSRESFRIAITGPVARADLGTVKIHLKNLLKYFPEFYNTYASVGWELAKFAYKYKKINRKQYDNIINLVLMDLREKIKSGII